MAFVNQPGVGGGAYSMVPLNDGPPQGYNQHVPGMPGAYPQPGYYPPPQGGYYPPPTGMPMQGQGVPLPPGSGN